MVSFERQQQIINILKENKFVTIRLLCKKLFASEATIRRDLNIMQKKGLIVRIRGGATLIKGTNQDTPLFIRSTKDKERKKIIAQLATEYINNSITLFMDSSSTVTFLAEKLSDFENLSIVTNGISTINVLNEFTSVKIFSTGGIIKNNSSMIGQLALNNISNFRADILFFSCCGLSTEFGTTEASEDNAEIKKLMCKNSKRRILLCDSTKFNQEFFCKVCDIKDIDIIITDKKPNDEFIKQIPLRTQLIY